MTEPGDAERDNSIEEKLVEIISKSFASLSALDSSFLKPVSNLGGKWSHKSDTHALAMK